VELFLFFEGEQTLDLLPLDGVFCIHYVDVEFLYVVDRVGVFYDGHVVFVKQDLLFVRVDAKFRHDQVLTYGVVHQVLVHRVRVVLEFEVDVVLIADVLFARQDMEFRVADFTLAGVVA